jgi:membrane protein insertase Oxa1/YidC/SpoIIIJ
MDIFNILFFKPSFNFVVFLSTFLPKNDLGLATIISALFLQTFFKIFSLNPQKIEKLKREIEELKKKYKEKETLNKEIAKLYQKEGINPLFAIIFPLFQMMITVAFIISFNQLRDGISLKEKEQLYSFLPSPSVSPLFLGFVDLAKPFLIYSNSLKFYWQALFLVFPNIILNFLLFKKTSTKTSSVFVLFQKQLFYLSLFLSLFLPAIFILFWLTNTAYSLILLEIKKDGARNN